MATKQELDREVAESRAKLDTAVKAFEALRSKGSATDLVTAGRAVTDAEKVNKKTEFEAEHFELVGIYEGIRGQVLELAKRWDIAALLAHEVGSVNIQLPLAQDDNGKPIVNTEQVSVNTLGKRTAVRSTGGGGNGSRAKKEMFNEGSGETMTPRDYLERFPDVLGDVTEKVLAEPSRYGLVDYAERCARKQDAGWVKRDIPA